MRNHPTLKTGNHISVGKVQLNAGGLLQPVKIDFQNDGVCDAYVSTCFKQLVFQTNGKTYTIRSKYLLALLNPPHHPHEMNEDIDIPGLPFHPSHFFRTGNSRDEAGEHTLLFFEGVGYASDAESALVIGFKESGEPYIVMQLEYFEPTEFLPGQNEVPTRIAGKTSLSQVMAGEDGSGPGKPYATTYDPFSVYVLSSTSGKVAYSLSESRAYNEMHYVWAGPRMSESYSVFYNIPGHQKPFGAPATQVSKILESAKSH